MAALAERFALLRLADQTAQGTSLRLRKTKRMPISLLCKEQDGATAINISCDLQTAQFVLHVAATVGIVCVILGYSGVKRRLTGRVRRLNNNFSVLAYLLAAWGLYVSLQSWDSHHGVLMDELSGASIAVTWLLAGAATYVTRDWSCRPFGWIQQALSVLALAVSLALLGVRVYMLRHGAAVAVADVVLSVGPILVLGAEVIISWRLPLASSSGSSALLTGINDMDGLGVPLLGAAAGSGTQTACDVPRRDFPQGPESRSSILSRLTFWWITPLLSKGYRQKSLGPDDLPPLEMDDQPAFTHAAFRRRWEKVRAEMLKRRREIEERGGASKRSSGWQLLKTILWVNWGSFWACGGVLLISTAVGLSVPMVLNMLLSHIEDGGRSDGGPTKGYALAVGLFILAVLQSLTEHQFWVCGVRCGMRAQSALMAETFRKALCLEPESRRRYSSGELINLMSVDACRVADVSIVPMVHWGTWCAVVMLVVSLVSLYALLGYSALVGIAVVLVFWPIGYLLGKQGKRAAMVIQQERDRRSRLMSEALESIRLLKSLQWEAFASSVLQSARRREVGAQIRRSVCFGGNGTLAQIAQVFGPLAAFTFRILVEGKPLTAAVAFTSLAWFNLLKRPLNILPSALTSLLDCLVSFERLEALFLTDEVISPCSAISSTEDASPASSTEALPVTAPSPPRGQEHSRSSRYLKPSSSTEEIPQSEDTSWAVELNNCTLSWSRRGPPAVRDINLRIRKGELVVIVGPVGAGKSTLLQSLVGDCLEVSGRGSVSVHGRIALVGQSPWVQDTSVRENVVFGAPIGFDRARFNEVVRCCGLTKDLALLASRGGEMMGTGEGGIGLSGGQRQRLGLARAVYSDPDICLLDDVLSSLDVPVGRQIWEDCLVKFMGDKTRVVVTHQTHFLQHPAVDRIVVIDDVGCMRAVGRYPQLLTSDDRFVVDTVLGHGHGNEPQQEREAMSEEVGLMSEGGETREVWTEAEERGSICKVGGLLGETQPMFGGEGPEPEEEVVAFMETEDRRKGGLELGLLLTYLQRFGGPGMLFPVLTLALFVLEQGVNVLQWFWLSRLTGESGRATDEEHVQQRRIYVLMALGGALCVITASRILTLMYGAVTAGNSLHSSMLSALLKAPVRFFDRQPSGRILNRFIADQAAIDSIVPGTLADFFQQLLYFGATLVVLCYALPEMIPVVVILALPYWAVSTYYRWPARDLRRLEAVSKSPVNSQFSEAVRGVSVIRAFNAQQRFLQRHLELSAHNISCYWTKWVANQWVTIWLELIGTVFMLGCAVLTVWVTTPGEAPAVLASHVDAGKMGLVMSYAVLVPTNLGWLLKVYFMAEIEFIAVERVAQYVGLESEDHVRTAAATASHVEGEEKLLVAVHDQGTSDGIGAALSLTARDVCMRYRESDKLTLKGMDLNVRAGEKAAIVGRTGAGKSSVFQLLLGFYGPELGSSCKVDGEEVVCMPTPSLRRKVRLIPQTPTLFGVTIRDVLTGDTNLDHDVAIWAALERVQMANAVRELPGGLHTPLADIEFSAGERQLLCIARALLNPAPVLLCDEVTSAIDLRTDTTIHDVILSLPSTVLLICHRLHRIREFDRVIVMDQGVTVEEGKPDDLLKNPMSHLSDMMRSADMSASGF